MDGQSLDSQDLFESAHSELFKLRSLERCLRCFLPQSFFKKPHCLEDVPSLSVAESRSFPSAECRHWASWARQDCLTQSRVRHRSTSLTSEAKTLGFIPLTGAVLGTFSLPEDRVRRTNNPTPSSNKLRIPQATWLADVSHLAGPTFRRG